MKKLMLILCFLSLIVCGYVGWLVLGPSVSAPEKKFFYIKTGSSFSDVKQSLFSEQIIKNPLIFEWIAKALKYTSKIKPGKYEINNGIGYLKLLRKLKSGNQAEVRLVINKIRTKEDFAGKIGAQFEVDSLTAIKFLLNNDSLKSFELDTNTVMTILIPNSYLFYWNGDFRKILSRLKKQHDYFWEGKRTTKANKIGLTPIQVYTLASIIEEETNKEEDKGKIASVYFNRYKKDMKLEADPTVKYAMRNFKLNRIFEAYLKYPSDYNTYLIKGIPPGPICTPSIPTIDAVLNMPATDYIFFVAKPDFNGYSNFSATYTEHLKNANAYQKALDSFLKDKEQKNKAITP